MVAQGANSSHHFLILILLGIIGLAFAIVMSLAYRETITENFQKYIEKSRQELEQAGINMRAETIGVISIVCSFLIWLIAVLLLHPSTLLALIILPSTLFLAIKINEKIVAYHIANRVKKFNEQLELVLRLMSSSVRAGLGLRQAMIVVTEEMADPAKYEFNLIILQTNIGVSIQDALAKLAKRMPSQETEMMVRAIAIQSQTGGNLGKTLDHLADTIKQRRRLARKVASLTSESKAAAFVLGGLPILLGLFLMATQETMRTATFGSNVGHIGLGIAAVLECLGIFVLYRILQVVV